jgi:hypothetical protein
MVSLSATMGKRKTSGAITFSAVSVDHLPQVSDNQSNDTAAEGEAARL